MSSSLREGNTLLQVPALVEGTEKSVYNILGSSPDDTHLLVISYRKGPDSWLTRWRQEVGKMPLDFGFIHIGETTRSATASSAPSRPLANFVDAVNSPSDLTGIGIKISEFLKRWVGAEKNIVFYLESITSMLQFAELNRVYRFLYVLTSRMQTVGSCAYYRINPKAHDSQTLATISELMDDSIELPE